MEYQSLTEVRNRHNETNDCAVVAVVIATGAPYEKVHQMMESKGRKSRRGTAQNITNAVLSKLGYMRFPIRDREVLTNGLTIRTLLPYLPEGTFLVHTPGHILCIRDGVVQDWSANRLLRVYKIEQVLPDTHDQRTYTVPESIVPYAPGKGTQADLIHAMADKLHKEAGSPTDIKELRKLRINIMDHLWEACGIRRTTASSELGKWQKIVLSKV